MRLCSNPQRSLRIAETDRQADNQRTLRTGENKRNSIPDYYVEYKE